MLPSPNSCIACDRPFPANGELVSLPQGRRIAFDPELGRVWRICTKCGEWNLLGTEAASEAVPELRARLQSAQPVDASPEAGLATIGQLEVLVLHDMHDAASTANQPARIRQVQRGRRVYHIFVIVVTILALGFLLFNPGGARDPGGRRWIGGIPVVAPIIWSYMLLGAAIRSKRLTGSYGQWRFMVAILLLTSVIGLNPVTPRYVAAVFVPAVLGLVLYRAFDRFGPMGRLKLRSGGRLWMTQQMIDETRLRWDDARTISLQLPNGTVATGNDAMTILRALLDATSCERGDPQLAEAAVIASGPDPLPRVLHLLRPSLQASPDGIMLGTIPVLYRAALDLALATRTGVTGKLSAMLARSGDAQQVASIAESLDRRG